MESQAITGWIDQLADGNKDAADQLWLHFSERLHEYAAQKLDPVTRRQYDEHDAANSAFHSLCRGLVDGRMEAENRDALWGLLAVITSRKVVAQRRLLNRQKRGEGTVKGDSAFDPFGGINGITGNQPSPDVLAEISESCAELVDAIEDETMKRIVLLKFQGATNLEVVNALDLTLRTVERKLAVVRGSGWKQVCTKEVNA